jgi:hypothetical protein
MHMHFAFLYYEGMDHSIPNFSVLVKYLELENITYVPHF